MRVNLARPVGMSIVGGRLYWADRALRRVFSAALSDVKTSVPQTEVSHLDDLVELALFDVAAQPQPPANFPCRRIDAQKLPRCEQLCFYSQRVFDVCACATGVLNVVDSRSCVEPPIYLLYLDGAQIGSASIEPDVAGGAQSQLVHPLTPIDGLAAFDYDSAEKKFYAYFSRAPAGASAIGWFHQVDVGVQNVRNVITGNDTLPDMSLRFREAVDVAIDWRTYKVYWTATLNGNSGGRIYSASTDGTQYATLVVGDMPYALALDPCAGLMFWTDLGRHVGPAIVLPRIERANMAGGNRLIIVDTDVMRPTSLAVDSRLRQIYWGDATQMKIWTADYDGQKRQLLAGGYRPRAMIVYQRWLYFSDGEASGSSNLTFRIHFRRNPPPGQVFAEFASRVGRKPCAPSGIDRRSRRRCTERATTMQSVECGQSVRAEQWRLLALVSPDRGGRGGAHSPIVSVHMSEQSLRTDRRR